MRTNVTRWLIALLAIVMTGCAAKRFEYRSATEIPEGPGMLSGEKGAFVLYSDSDVQGGVATAAPNASSSSAASATAATSAPATDAERREFEEFKRWKEANRDSAEYREFREWQEWKAFQAWKKKTQ